VYKNVCIEFISANLNRSLHNQSASSQSVGQRNPVCGKIAIWPSIWQRHLNLGNNTVTFLWNQIKLTKDHKQCLVIIWLDLNRGMSTMLGNYSGPWLGKKKVVAVQQTKRATMQKQPKQIIKYNHITTMGWSYYDIMMERYKCAVAEFRNWNVFNESWKRHWKRHWNFSLKSIDFRHSAVAYFYRSRGTLMSLVCRGTQVEKHCFRGYLSHRTICMINIPIVRVMRCW